MKRDGYYDWWVGGWCLYFVLLGLLLVSFFWMGVGKGMVFVDVGWGIIVNCLF